MRHISDKQVSKLASLLVSLQGLLDSLESQKYVLSAEAAKKLEEFAEAKRCLLCELPLDGETRRGCHQSCYNKVKAAIRRGELTEQDAIEVHAYLTPEAGTPGRKSNRPDPLREKRKNLRAEPTPDITPSVAAGHAAIGFGKQVASRDKRRDKPSKKTR